MIHVRQHTLRLFCLCQMFILLSACLLLAPMAHADGCYIPPVAYQKLPEIPLQRAILTWRGGTERMIVESTFKGEGDRFGWVIPLPAVPTRFEATTPGLLKTLAFNTQPNIVHHELVGDEAGLLFWVFLGCFTVLAILNTLYAYGNGGIRPARLLISQFGWTLLIVFLWALFTPNFLGGENTRSASPIPGAFSGINIEKQTQIGNYKVEVLKAETPEALARWLKESGFAPLPPEGIKIVGDLIKEKWCFVAARLQREGKGIGRPHPMAITFPSDKLLYPMRLTALAGSPVYLELFVIGDQQAACAPLKTDFCDRFDFDSQEISGTVVLATQPDEKRGSHYKRCVIAHPDAKRELWRGCVLTRLSGTLSPRQMRSDLTFAWRDLKPFRRTLYTRQTALLYTFLTALGIGLAGLLFMLLWLGKGKRYPDLAGYQAAFRRGLGIAALGGVAAGAGTFIAIPATEAIIKSSDSYRFYMREIIGGLLDMDDLPPRSLESLRKKLTAEISTKLSTPDGWIFKTSPTGETFHEEDSPGNYILYETEKGIGIRIYSLNGYPFDSFFFPKQKDTATSATK